MRAYRLPSERRIAPFDDPARDLHVATRTLAEWQQDACSGAGLELTEVASPSEATERPCVLFYDDVFFTEMALRNFLAGVLRTAEDAALAMPSSGAVRALAILQDTPEAADGSRAFDVFYLASATRGPPADRASLRASCRPHVQVTKERGIPLRLPPGASDSVEAPLTARICAHVVHWVHVLRLSQLAVGVMLIDRLRKAPALALRLRLSRGFGGADPWKAARALSFVDPTARVHPTADLEAAIIGPECTVRAHAHVHGSVLGRGVDVGDHAAVMGCTLADRTQVLRASYLAHCAAMPGGTLASYKVQLSLFGRDVFLTTSAWLFDAKLKGDIRVEHEGGFVSVGSPFLGCCLGHRVTLGAQVALPPGRAVPNGLTIVGPPDHVALDVPRHPEGTMLAIIGGRAVPIGGTGDPGTSVK